MYERNWEFSLAVRLQEVGSKYDTDIKMDCMQNYLATVFSFSFFSFRSFPIRKRNVQFAVSICYVGKLQPKEAKYKKNDRNEIM